MQLFLRSLGKARLLTAQEEVELANRIERGSSTLSKRWSSRTCRR